MHEVLVRRETAATLNAQSKAGRQSNLHYASFCLQFRAVIFSLFYLNSAKRLT